MKKYLVIVIALIVALNTTTVFANERGSLGFNYFDAQYQFNDTLQKDLGLKEITGGLDLKYGFSLSGDYTFGEYSNLVNVELDKGTLNLTRDFIAADDTKLALGTGVNYSNLSTSFWGKNLFDIESKGVHLVADLEKNLTDKIGVFAQGTYGLESEYQVKYLEDSININELTGYQVNSNYDVQAGFNIELASDLNFKLGYRVQQEDINNDSLNAMISTTDEFDNIINEYNLTEVNRLTQGIFFGAETNF